MQSRMSKFISEREGQGEGEGFGGAIFAGSRHSYAILERFCRHRKEYETRYYNKIDILENLLSRLLCI